MQLWINTTAARVQIRIPSSNCLEREEVQMADEDVVFERVTVEFKSGVRESKRTHINYK